MVRGGPPQPAGLTLGGAFASAGEGIFGVLDPHPTGVGLDLGRGADATFGAGETVAGALLPHPAARTVGNVDGACGAAGGGAVVELPQPGGGDGADVDAGAVVVELFHGAGLTAGTVDGACGAVDGAAVAVPPHPAGGDGAGAWTDIKRKTKISKKKKTK